MREVAYYEDLTLGTGYMCVLDDNGLCRGVRHLGHILNRFLPQRLLEHLNALSVIVGIIPVDQMYDISCSSSSSPVGSTGRNMAGSRPMWLPRTDPMLSKVLRVPLLVPDQLEIVPKILHVVQ